MYIYACVYVYVCVHDHFNRLKLMVNPLPDVILTLILDRGRNLLISWYGQYCNNLNEIIPCFCTV